MSYDDNDNLNSNEEINKNNDILNSINENDANKHKSLKVKLLIVIFAVLFFVLLIFIILTKTCLVYHDWKEATCESPKTCGRCGETEGEPLGHDWVDADCESPKTCIRCKKTEGNPLGHQWVDATCKDPKTCSRCKKTEGTVLTTHKIENQNVLKAATCTEQGTKEGVCSVCNKKVTDVIPATGHNYIDSNTTKYASMYSAGEKTRKCTKCGDTVSVTYNLSEAEKSNIDLVKNGMLNKYTSKTVGNAFAGFFSDPAWYASGNYVVFSGGCTWNGDPTTAYIGFKVSGDTFELDELEIGDQSFNSLAWTSIMNKVYGLL